MSTLKVPGARLSYEVSGSGPLMILVPGAAGVGEVFLPLARLLSVQYQVVTGRSPRFFPKLARRASGL
jgi:hypothetical protein